MNTTFLVPIYNIPVEVSTKLLDNWRSAGVKTTFNEHCQLNHNCSVTFYENTVAIKYFIFKTEKDYTLFLLKWS